MNMVGVVVTLVLASLSVSLGGIVIVGSINVLRREGIVGWSRCARVGSLFYRRFICSVVRGCIGRGGVPVRRIDAAPGRRVVGVGQVRCFVSVGGEHPSDLSAVEAVVGSP